MTIPVAESLAAAGRFDAGRSLCGPSASGLPAPAVARRE